APGAAGEATLPVAGRALADGLYGGTVTADPAGDPAAPDDLRTPVAVRAAPPTVGLTIAPTPPPGVPAGTRAVALAAVTNLDDYAEFAQLLIIGGPPTTPGPPPPGPAPPHG